MNNMTKIDKSKDKRIGYNQRHAVYYDLKITDAILLNYIQHLKRRSHKVPDFYRMSYKNFIKRFPQLSKHKNFYRTAFKRLENAQLIERDNTSNDLYLRSLPVNERANDEEIVKRNFCSFNPDHIVQGVNIKKAIIIDYLMDLSEWANCKDDYYFITYKKMRDDLKSLSINVSYFKDIVKELREIKVVERHPDKYKTYLWVNTEELENLAKKEGKMDVLEGIKNTPSKSIENTPESAPKSIENNPPNSKEIEKKDNSCTSTTTTFNFDQANFFLLAQKKEKSKLPPSPPVAVNMYLSKPVNNIIDKNYDLGEPPINNYKICPQSDSTDANTIESNKLIKKLLKISGGIEMIEKDKLEYDVKTNTQYLLDSFADYFLNQRKFKVRARGQGNVFILTLWGEFLNNTFRRIELGKIKTELRVPFSDDPFKNALRNAVRLGYTLYDFKHWYHELGLELNNQEDLKKLLAKQGH